MVTTSSFFRSILGNAAGTFDIPLSMYGKLPIYKDFLRTNLVGPEAAALRVWLDRGWSRFWESRDACREAVIRPHAFLLCFPDVSRYVLGYLWGSHDSGGLRRFPFVLFGALPTCKGSAHLVGFLLALGAALRELRAMQESIMALPGVEAFNERARGFSLHLEVPREEEVAGLLRRELAGVLDSEYADSLYGAETASKWPALLAYLARARDGEMTGRVAARLPASNLLPVVSQAALWSYLVLGEEGRRRPALGVILAPGDPAAGVVVLDRYLRTDDVLLLNPDLAEYDFVEDLRGAVPRGAGAEPSGSPSGKPLAALVS